MRETFLKGKRLVVLGVLLLAALPVLADSGEKRPLPDYDGRAEEPASAGDVLIWIPRVLLYPVHLTLEYVVRWPIVGLTTLTEKHYVIPWFKRIFIWADGKAGIFPTAYYEFGLNPNVGFYSFLEDILFDRHKLILRGGFWTSEWVHLAMENRWTIFRDNSGTFSLDARYLIRPDKYFYGIGYDTRHSSKSFFRAEMVEAAVGLEGRFSGLNGLSLRAAFRSARFSGGISPSIEEKHSVEGLSGFGGYNLAEAALKLELDSRSPLVESTPGSGLRLELSAAFAMDPGNADLHFLRWGGEASGFLDLSGVNHVLGLRLYTEFIEKTGDDPVPFYELVTLGGLERMRGFFLGRFRGPSALMLTLDYRYPIWSYLDANAFVGLGNAFEEHLRGFTWDRLHLVWGMGVRSNTSRDVSFDIMLAFGSNRLDAGSLNVDEIHFVVGVNQGF